MRLTQNEIQALAVDGLSSAGLVGIKDLCSEDFESFMTTQLASNIIRTKGANYYKNVFNNQLTETDPEAVAVIAYARTDEAMQQALNALGHFVQAYADWKSGSCVEGHATNTPGVSRKLPTRGQVKITVWEERDNLHIAIIDKTTEQITYAEWRDDDARQMFEDGFFKRGIIHRQLDQVADDKMTNSILDYAEDMGILAK